LPTPEPNPLRAPGWLNAAVIALAGLFLLGLFSIELSDTDSWWHLASGRYIAQTHKLPSPDPFAYTTAGAPNAYPGEAATRHFNLTHEWLAQLAMYGIEAAGGMGAVVFGKALLLALLCGAVGWSAARRTGSLLWGTAAALAAASLAIEFAHDRPSILSYVFTAVFILICERGRRLWLLPVLSLVWANCHGGYFLGWVVVGAYAAEAVLRRSADVRRWLAVGLATIVISGANPNGFGALTAVFRYRHSPLQASLMEWSPASLWGSPYAFDVLLYLAVAAMILSWRRVRPADWMLAAVFIAGSLVAFRNAMLVGVQAPILIVDYFPWKRRLPRVANYALAAALAAGVIWGAASGRFFQLRAAEWRFPVQAARFLNDHNIRGPLFNTYEYGGYLIWEGERVFIDGRALSERVFQDYRWILGSPPADPGRQRAFEQYGITAIVANGFEYNSGALYPLLPTMISPHVTGWHLVYEDPQAVVFVRDVPPGVTELPPARLGLHLEAECLMHVEHDPDFSLCARTLGDLFMRAHDRVRARRWLRYYLDHPYGDDPAAQRAYMQLFQQ